MSQKKLPLINSEHDSETRNIINELIKLFNNMGYTYNESLQKAQDILEEARQTNDMNESVQQQINTLIAESGSSDAEVLQARIDAEGNEYAILKDRLDEKEQYFSSQLAQTANYGLTNIYDFELDKVRFGENKPSNIETYVEKSNAILHPSVLRFEDGWNGYKYWMAATPYTDNNFIHENPSIFVSNNGDDWEVPSGLSNPVYGYKGDVTGGYNADTNLFMDESNKVMYMIWREKIYRPNVRNAVQMLSSTDGVNWTNFKTIIDEDGEDNGTPCVIRDKGKYKLFSIDLLKIGNTIKVFEADNPNGEWVRVKEIDIPVPSNTAVWHFEIKVIENMYVCIYTVGPDTAPSGNNEIYITKSYDLEVWNEPKKLDIAPLYDKRYYKPSIVPLYTKPISFEIWYSVKDFPSNEFSIVKNTLYFNDPPRKTDGDFIKNTDILLGKKIIYDGFNRPDSNVLGETFNGLDWEAISGEIRVKNNYAVVSSDSSSMSIVQGSKSGVLECDLHSLGVGHWLIFGYKDYSNYYRVGINSHLNGTISLYKDESGVSVLETVAVEGLSLLDNINLKLEIDEDEVTVWVNNQFVFSHPIDLSEFGSGVGILSSRQGAAFKNFYFSYHEDDFYSSEKTTEIYHNKLRDGLLGINKQYLVDSFNRVDGSLNTAPFGATWENFSGGLVINKRKVVAPTTGSHISMVDVGASKFKVSASLLKVGSQACLVIGNNATDYYRLGVINTSGVLRLEKVISGARTNLAGYDNLVYSDNSIIQLEYNNGDFTIYFNDEMITTVHDVEITNPTKVGLQTNELTTQFGSILVEL